MMIRKRNATKHLLCGLKMEQGTGVEPLHDAVKTMYLRHIPNFISIFISIFAFCRSG